MRVCIDISAAAHERAGLGRYAASLATALLPLLPPGALSIFFNHPRESRLPEALAGLPRHTWPWGNKPWRMRALVSQVGGPSLDSAIRGIDVFHATDHLLPRLSGPRSVFTLHDVAYHWFPEYHLPLNRWFLRLAIPRFLARADAVIAVSEATRRDALALYGLPPEKVCAVPEGVDERFHPARDGEALNRIREIYALPKRFILCVSTIEPRKNLTMLLEAYVHILPAHPEMGLVIAGQKGWLYEGFFERLRSLGLESKVRLTGYVPEDDLPLLMSAAEVFAYPSKFEGFGLPPLEAMACGTPVVASNASSLPEVVEDGGVQLPPDDLKAWIEGLQSLIERPEHRAEYSARGQAQAAKFTWETAARKTLSVYEKVGISFG